MSTSSISSASISSYQLSQQAKGIRSSIRQLGQALQSGDLAGAQQIYGALSQSPQFQNAVANQSNGSSDTSGNSFLQGLTAVGNALQSGDLSGAQQAFSSLQSQIQGASAANAAGPTQGGHHHHHHVAAAGATSAATSDSSSTDDSDGTSINDEILALLTNIENTLSSIGSNTSGSTGSATAATASFTSSSSVAPVSILA